MKRTIFDLLFRRTPVSKAKIRGSRHEPPALSHQMDAGRMHDILRAAEAGQMDDFFSLARDIVSGHGHALTEFSKRKLAVVAETESVTAVDSTDERQQRAAEEIANHIESLPSFFDACVHLLDSTIYPVSVVEKVWVPSSRPGWRFELADLIPVPYRLLDFNTGTLRIRDVGPDGQATGTTHHPDPMRYVIHRGHLLVSVPDTWGGPMRAIIFWWLFAVMGRDWWARFLERFGSPFLEGTYNKDDDESRILLERAFSSATRLFGIAVPEDASVKIHQANATGGGDAFEKFQGTANREISKIILGQTLSAEGQNLGLGGGQAGVQADVRDDIRRFDARRLAQTVRSQIFAPLCQLNAWHLPTPRIAWGGDDVDDLEVTGDLLRSLRDAGLEVTDEGIDQLSKRMALPLRRAATSAGGGGFGPLSALASLDPGRGPADRSQAARDAVDAAAAKAAPSFAEAMALTLSPLAAIVERSSSIADLEARIREAIPGLDYRKAASLAEAALVSSSANAALNAKPR